MNRKLLTLTIASALALGGGAAIADEQAGEHKMVRKHMHGHGGMKLERLTKQLDLTPQQEAQIKPIIDQVKPQIKAIHEEAMQKSKAVMDESAAKIRPILNAEQQAKFDKLREAREKMREARKAMREAHQD